MTTRTIRSRPVFLVQILGVSAATILLTLTLIGLSRNLGSPVPHPDLSSPALIIHLATALPALPLGAWLLFRKKGDSQHRLLGGIWIGLMAAVAISSFWLSGFGSRFSFIHIFSVVTLASLASALLAIRAGKIEQHRRSMIGVFIGLLIAGMFALLPGRLLYDWVWG